MHVPWNEGVVYRSVLQGKLISSSDVVVLCEEINHHVPPKACFTRRCVCLTCLVGLGCHRGSSGERVHLCVISGSG